MTELRSPLDLISRVPSIPAILRTLPTEQLEEGGGVGPWLVRGWRLSGVQVSVGEERSN